MEPLPISAPVPDVVGIVITGTKWPPSGNCTAVSSQKSNFLTSSTLDFAYIAIDLAASNALPPILDYTYKVAIIALET